MIELNRIYKSFDKLEVLKGIDFSMTKGQVTAIIGPSGSGKSTLLRCINFSEVPDRGVVKIDNISIDSSKFSQKDVRQLRETTGMVFQNYNLFKHKTAIENVMEGLIVVKKMKKMQNELEKFVFSVSI